MLFLLQTLASVFLMSMLQATITRMRIDQTVGLWWHLGAMLALLQILVLIL